ncbi:MAG: VWA domain-containing protein [Bacilli bacterium]|nr:VWA domain-containing protein [Bacilli bacterium]
MKTNKLLTIIFLVILAFIFSACATKDAGYTAKHDYSDEYSSGEVGGGDFGYKIEPSGLGVDDEYIGYGEYESEPSTADFGYSENGNKYRSGQLTVKAYNDNENWDYYRDLIQKDFVSYQNNFKLACNRIKLSFKGLSNVRVTLYKDNDEVDYIAYSDALGNAYLFTNSPKEEYKVRIEYSKNDNNIDEIKTVKNNDEIDLSIENSLNNIIQLMFVIDTTGSMGDEIRYLQSEIADVIKRVKEDNNQITIYLSLLFYRDHGDEYVTRYFDFTTDIDSQIKNLSKQYAQGGGDFEEAVDEALDLASKQQWFMNSSTNILVHVADAPAHNSLVNNWFNAVDKLASENVKIINVASSGIDKLTEYFFRNECFRTNCYYCYLTNHSGIGGGHIDATVPDEPSVEFLNDCLVRLINGIHTGDMKAPVDYQQKQPEQQAD